MKINIDNAAVVYKLDWDSKFFKLKCGKAILHKPLKTNQWDKIRSKFDKYQFISIENRNSEPTNSQLIGKNTNAFLADVNIQFKKVLDNKYKYPEGISISNVLKENEEILEIADFKYSRFSEDPDLNIRGGDKVHKQCVLNSFEKNDKYFAISVKENKIDGFLLHNYSDQVCVIELIAVSKYSTNKGTGSKLFKAVEYSAFQKGCKEISVGTQVRNIEAVNFYHKIGCRQIGCHQIFHLWNYDLIS